MLLYPNLAKMAGSHWLEARVRAVHGPHGAPTACHVFGHTHFHWDSRVDGIRPLCATPGRERGDAMQPARTAKKALTAMVVTAMAA
ncbi:hypothetical protein CLOM_g5590 [Closterium sp. NIES-68]|nr:hypothetical protein CLOM_g5590 [Closterium sp. NIES-68]